MSDVTDTRPEAGAESGADPVVQPRLGLRGWLRWMWRQLTSMRTALQLLLLLALAAIPGSVFPQRSVNPTSVSQYLLDHRSTGEWLDRVSAFDVYSSPWFSAIYLLLFISLIGCIVPRTRVHFRAARAQPPRTPARPERMPAYVKVQVPDGDRDALLTSARVALGKRRYRVASYGRGEDTDSWAGEKGFTSETGNLIFHLALLGLLAAVAAGSFLSYSGQRVLIEGDTFANTLPGYDSFNSGTRVGEGDLPPFAITLNSLSVKFDSTPGDQFGAPRDFDAEVTVRNDPDEAAEKQKLAVNHPVNVDGARVFLVGNGYAPVITVKDKSGKVVYSQAVPFRAVDANYTSDGVVKIADGLPGQYGLIGTLLPTAVTGADGRPTSIYPDIVEPRLLLGAYKGTLYPDGQAQSVYVLDTENMTQLTKDGDAFRAILAVGDTTELPDGSGTVTFEGIKRYAALDIRADPTKKYVLAFAVLGLSGLIGSLFIRRRRVWVRVRPYDGEDGGSGGQTVEIAGLPRRDDARLPDELAQILAEVVPASAVPDDARTLEPATASAADHDEERKR